MVAAQLFTSCGLSFSILLPGSIREGMTTAPSVEVLFTTPRIFFIPIPNEVGEYTGFTLPVCLSVGPSVDGMVSRAWYQYTSEFEFHISYAYSLCHCLDVHWVVQLKVLCFIIFTSKYWSSYWFKFLYQNMVWPKNVVVAKIGANCFGKNGFLFIEILKYLWSVFC